MTEGASDWNGFWNRTGVVPQVQVVGKTIYTTELKVYTGFNFSFMTMFFISNIWRSWKSVDLKDMK